MAPQADFSNWAPQVYTVFSMVLAPLVVVIFLPLSVVDKLYIASSASIVFVSIWTLLQTAVAWWSVSSSVCKSFNDARRVTPYPRPFLRRPKIAYLVPAYLNNEAEILDDTLQSYCDLEYRGEALVVVVFNSKGDMLDVEAELMAKWDGIVCGAEKNIRVRIVKNFESSSKAENVNHGLSLIPADVEYIAIMDADHQPSPDNASVAMNTMLSKGYDILQGACTIRNQENFLCEMISVEFEHMYCVAHQGRFRVFGLGLFVGSNGYWRSSVLQDIGMDKSMLTEDVDSSIRALLAGYKIGQSSDVVSSELAPRNRTVLQKQRLRWAQGWTEASVKHVGSCTTSTHLSLRQKVGLLYLLGWREIFPYTMFWPLWCIAGRTLRVGSLDFALSWIVIGVSLSVFGLARVVAAYGVCRGPIGSNVGAFLLFSIWGVFFDAYLNFIQVCGHGRYFLKANAWVATVR